MGKSGGIRAGLAPRDQVAGGGWCHLFTGHLDYNNESMLKWSQMFSLLTVHDFFHSEIIRGNRYG